MNLFSENHSRKVIILLCLVSILLTISCACLPSKSTIFSQEPTATEEIAATATKAVPTKIPTQKPKPSATATEAIDQEATDLASIIVEEDTGSQRAWSLPVYPDAVMLISDLDGDSDYDDIVAMHARNLSIEEPYYYEFYSLPYGLRYDDIRSFYQEKMPALGYKQAADMQGGSEIYLLTFVNSGGSTARKVVIQYWHTYDMLMIIYKNPE